MKLTLALVVMGRLVGDSQHGDLSKSEILLILK